MMKSKLCAAALVFAAAPALAADANQKMVDYAQQYISSIAGNTDVIAAIAAQNTRTADLSGADIVALDTTWRDEVDGSDRPMINEVLGNPVSDFLTGLVGQSDGVITEVFVMDARGLNVGQSAVTSDYWQGDEAKFTETYMVGPDAMHVSEVELDESTQTYQAQVSVSIADPATGDPIGAITFGIDATSFF